MSDQNETIDPTATPEAETEDAPRGPVVRIKNALKKAAPYTAYITTAVVVAVGGALIYQAVSEQDGELQEDDSIDVIPVEDGFMVIETDDK